MVEIPIVLWNVIQRRALETGRSATREHIVTLGRGLGMDLASTVATISNPRSKAKRIEMWEKRRHALAAAAAEAAGTRPPRPPSGSLAAALAKSDKRKGSRKKKTSV